MNDREVLASTSGKAPFGKLIRHRSDQLIKITSRLGVWGFVGGFGAMTAFTLGAPLSLGAAISLMGGGLVLSGVGTGAASVLAHRRLDSECSLLRIASIAGMPLGVSLTLLGTVSLFQWEPLVSVVHAITSSAGFLGVLLILLLIIAFVSQWRNRSEDG